MRYIDEDDLTKEQLKAIKSLETALKKCADVGVSLYGMSGDLIAYNGIKLSEAHKNGEAHFNSEFAALKYEFPHKYVKDHGAYIDSGADDPWYYSCETDYSREDEE